MVNMKILLEINGGCYAFTSLLYVIFCEDFKKVKSLFHSSLSVMSQKMLRIVCYLGNFQSNAIKHLEQKINFKFRDFLLTTKIYYEIDLRTGILLRVKIKRPGSKGNRREKFDLKSVANCFNLTVTFQKETKHFGIHILCFLRRESVYNIQLFLDS